MVRCGHVTPAPPLIGQDAIRAVTNVDDYAGSAQALAATTLRNVLGTRTLGDILSDRVKIAQEMHVGCYGDLACHSQYCYNNSRICWRRAHCTGAWQWRGWR